MKSKSIGNFYLVNNSSNHCSVSYVGKIFTFKGLGMPLAKITEDDLNAAIRYLKIRGIFACKESLKDVLSKAYSLIR